MVKLHPDTLHFFEELNLNNNRDWFQSNKSRWEAIRKDFLAFTQALIDQIGPLDRALGSLVPEKCVYRIYRDVRFSADKRPYKTHIACFLPAGGSRKCSVPGYYLQVGCNDEGMPDTCCLGGGIFMPEPAQLEAIRQEIFYCTEEFKSIMAEKDFKRFFGEEFWTIKKLQRVPRGYPGDWPDADLLKYKDYTTMYAMPKEVVLGEEMLSRTVEVFRASVPLNLFLQKALDMRG